MCKRRPIELRRWEIGYGTKNHKPDLANAAYLNNES
jgi:hypothetical protein